MRLLNVHSILFRLIALGVLLSAIGIAVRQMVAMPMLDEQVRQLAEVQQMALARYVARDVDQQVHARLALIASHADDLAPELLGNPQRLQAWVRDRQRGQPAFSGGLLVVRPDGRGLLAEYPVAIGRRAADYMALDWMKAALRENRSTIGSPARETVAGNAAVVFAAPVRDAAGKVTAVLAGVALLDTPGFLDKLQDTALGETGGFLLISPADRLFVSSTDPSMILKPTPARGVDLLHDRAMSGYRGCGVTVNARSIEELACIESVPATGWFLVARMPTAEAFRPAREMRDFAVRSNVILVVVVLGILGVAVPHALRPLIEAGRAMREMADGTRPLAQLPVRHDDEVGDLTRGFNVLVDRLHAEVAAHTASEERFRYMAQHDALTGLYNRSVLEDRLQQAMARNEREGGELALLFCDLDGFKPINDAWGHEAGDAVLRAVAERLSDGRRRVDTVARLGGDEFAILLTGLTDARAGAAIVARQCLDALAEPVDIGGHAVDVGMSVGIAVHAGPAVAPGYLIAQADIAMYQVKRRGKGDYFFIDAVEAAGGGTPAA